MSNTSNLLDVKGNALFPFHFKAIAFLLLGTSVIMLFSHPLVAGIILLVSTFILTSHEGVRFDKTRGTYWEYTSYLFIKTGKTYPYQEVEKVYVNSGQVSQKIYTAHTNDSSTFRNVLYRGYVKFSNGKKVFIDSHKDKKIVAHKLSLLARYLDTQLVDHSQE